MYRWILLALLVLGFVYDLIKALLTHRQRQLPIPENIREVYDAEAYARWRAYSGEKSRLSMISKAVDLAVYLVLFSTNALSGLYRLLPGGNTLRSMLLMLLYILAVSLISLPFSYLRTFRIEQKYGFNKSTRATFFSDECKSFLLTLLLCEGLYLLADALYRSMGFAFFIVFYCVVAVVMLAISMLSMKFQKIFYKFTPLEEGELRTTLADMFAAQGYQLQDIYVKDASRRTTHANAFCTGLGKFKSIVLDDNLVNNYTPREIAAVFAHELAHFKHRDTAKLSAYSLLMVLVITLTVAALVLVPQISMDFGFSQTSTVFAVIVLMSSVITPIMTLVAIPQAVLSRACERRADRFAAGLGYGPELISALKKLHGDSLSDLNPHPLIVALEYTHPTLSQRVALVEETLSK